MKYILFAFIFCACSSNAGKTDSRKFSNELLDTIRSAGGRIVSTPVLFESAFINGTTQIVNKNVFSFYGITVGKLKVKTGYLIACDPLHVDEYGIPFTQLFPTGEFPVQLAIAKYKTQESIAFARISFSDAPVEKWEFALQKGQKPMPVGGEEMHGFSADAGIGLFMDKETRKAFDRKSAGNTVPGIFREMENHHHNKWRYAMYNIGNDNLAAFSTGFGDGYYGTYIGFDAAGNACRLLADFGLFDWKQNGN